MRVVNKLIIDKSSVNREEGTFRVRSSTTAKNLRMGQLHGQMKPYYEILSHDPAHIDLSFVETGAAPFLLNHKDDVRLGDILSAEVEGNATYTTVKIAESQRKKVFDHIDDNRLTHVSVGGRTDKLISRSMENGIPVFVYSWKYSDLSFTPNPADPSAHIVRNNSNENTDVVVDTMEGFIAVGEDEMFLDTEEMELVRNALDEIDTALLDLKEETQENAVVEATVEKTEDKTAAQVVDTVSETVAPVVVPPVVQDFVPPAAKELPSEIKRSAQFSNSKPKEVKMTRLFNLISAVSQANLSNGDVKTLNLGEGVDTTGMTILSPKGDLMITNTQFARSFAAGTGVDTTGLTDQGGPLIGHDHSPDYIANIYGRQVLYKSGVPFVPFARPTYFPVITEVGAAEWINENEEAIPATVRTRNVEVKPHYIRLIYDVSVSAIKEARQNYAIERIFADDWNAKIGALIQKAWFKGNPAADPSSPTGIIPILTSNVAYAANVIPFAGTMPTMADVYKAFAVLEEARVDQEVVVYANSTVKYTLAATPLEAGQVVYMMRDTGSGIGELLGRKMFSVPSDVLGDDELLIGAPSTSFVAVFHDALEVLEDTLVLAGSNQIRYIIRTANDVFFRYPKHFVYMKKT